MRIAVLQQFACKPATNNEHKTNCGASPCDPSCGGFDQQLLYDQKQGYL